MKFVVAWAVLLLSMMVAVTAAPTRMQSGWYYPTDRVWVDGKAEAGWLYSVTDPKQPYTDGSSGGRIYGYLEPDYVPIVGTQHVGMDIRQSFNSPVYAVAAGTIHRYYNTGDSRYYAVVVRHVTVTGKVFYAVYGHCRLKAGYAVGRNVSAGEVFAYVNESINQHLHFGIKLNDDFSTGWGRLATDKNAEHAGWRPPRTWLSENAAPGSALPVYILVRLLFNDEVLQVRLLFNIESA